LRGEIKEIANAKLATVAYLLADMAALMELAYKVFMSHLNGLLWGLKQKNSRKAALMLRRAE